MFLSESLVRILNLAPPSIDYIGYFRLVDNPKIMYELIPGSFIDGSPVNKQGFRNKRNFVTEKPKNLVRIAVLGDSIAQGLGVPVGGTFSSQLEELLNQEAIAGKDNLRYEVMNFGVGGYNLEAEVEILRLKVLQYSPDIVILNLFHNDNDPMPNMVGLFFYNNNPKQKLYLMRKYFYNHNSRIETFMRKLLFKSKLYLFLRERLPSFNRDMRIITALHKEDYSATYGMKGIYNGFSEINHLQAEYNFKFLICIHCHLIYAEHSNNKRFAKIAELFHFPSFHMINYYNKWKVSPESIRLKDSKDVCHPNASGHAIIAKAMLIELRKNFPDIVQAANSFVRDSN